MFGQDTQLTQSNVPLYPQMGAMAASQAAPQEYGISSAVRDLLDAAANVVDDSEQLRSALGISVPKEPSKPANDSTLIGAIAAATQGLRAAHGNLNDCFRHIKN